MSDSTHDLAKPARAALLTALLLTCAVATSPACAADAPGAKIVVDREEHVFGVLDPGIAGRHEFRITNTGTGPLVLRRGKSTCGCCTCVCTVQMPEGPIAPGQTGKVRLEWISKVYTGLYRQTETLLTNDPQRPEVKLYVSGRYGSPVRSVPETLVFSRVPAGEGAAGEMRVYCYAAEPLRIAESHWADPATAPSFQVALDPLTAEQLREEPIAQSGYRLRVTVRPGLPLGAFRQRLALKTNLKAVPNVDIAIQGEVTEPITIVGRGWDTRTGVLSLGTLDGRQGAVWPLVLMAHGAHAKQVQFKRSEVKPPWLGVELGPTALGQDGASSRTPLTLRIAPGSRPAAHLGAGQGEPGRIVFQTSHPRLPELRVEVRFAVTD